MIIYYRIAILFCYLCILLGKKRFVMQNIIAIENGVTRHPLYRMKEPVNMTLAAGEHIAVVGRNGAGKVYW